MVTRFERWYLSVTLFALIGALAFFLSGQPQTESGIENVLAVSEEGDINKQVVLLTLYGIGVVLLIRHSEARMLLVLGVPLLLLLSWTFVTVAWSSAPDGTLRRAVALLGTVIVGIFAGLRFDTHDLFRVFSNVTAFTLIGSILLAVVLPSFGLDYEGRLRGFFAHKNSIGHFAALAFVTLICCLTETQYHRTFRKVFDGFLCLICIACLILSRSALPIVALAGALAVLLAMYAARTSNVFLFAATVMGGIAIAVLPFIESDIIIAVLGRDFTFSGRTLIWDFVKQMIGEQPWIGYGYGAFWLGPHAPAAIFWDLSPIQDVTQAHNGYLQLMLDTGGIGGILFAAALIVLLVRLTWLARHTQTSHLSWYAAFITLFLLMNLAEARLWVANDVMTMLFVYVSVRTKLAMQLAHASAASTPTRRDERPSVRWRPPECGRSILAFATAGPSDESK